MARDRIRVTVQLISTQNEEHVWSENYDRKLDDIFAIQTDIAKQVAETLRMKLLEEEKERLDTRPTENVSAYMNYLKGRGLLSRRKADEFRQAKQLFELTIAEDPRYAPGYAGLADAYAFLGNYFELPNQFAQQKAKELVLKALELDPNLAEAHASLGLYLLNDYEFTKAEEEFRKAIALNPSYANAHLWYSFALASLGRYPDFLRELKLAEDADPLSISVLNNEITYFEILGLKEDAAKRLKKALEIDPDHPMTNDTHGFYYYLKGDYEHAIQLLLEGSKLVKDSNNPNFRADLALAYAAAGDREKAAKWLRELISIPEETGSRAAYIAYVYAGLGETDEFFAFANRAFNEKSLNFGDIRLIDRVIPGTRKIRDDPRFAELFSRAGLKLEAEL